jgi:hypothetical protein
MHIGGFVLAACFAFGCAGDGARVLEPGGDTPPSNTANPGGAVGTHEAPIVRVELRGLDQLRFDDGSRIDIERFVVSFGEVSLLRDVADPAGARVDIQGRRLPVLPAPGESGIDRFIIGREGLDPTGFRGIRLELSPPSVPTSSADDGANSTIFIRGTYTSPDFTNRKADEAKISPNPAPIMPGASQQSLTSNVQVPFTFESRRSEGLLVALTQALSEGRSVVVVFPANRWFTDVVRAFFLRDATTRAALGIPADTLLRLTGEGIDAETEAQGVLGVTLEDNILESIGIEER